MAAKQKKTSSKSETILNLTAVRRRFPSLKEKVGGVLPAFFDNPGGTQVTGGVIDAIRDYYLHANSNQHGEFHTSHQTDKVIDSARTAMADFLNAPSANSIVFGANMTSLTFAASRAIGKTLTRGDQIIVTHMDHDANIAPWLLIARDHGLKVRWAEFDPATGRLDLEGMQKLITPKTRLIAAGYASNALGTINDVKRIVEMAHSVGAMAYIDAVQYAPHGPINVQELDADFLVCSSYKFFGPHAGILYGKSEHLTNLPVYKVRPSPAASPESWETGTKNHEGIAGIEAAIAHFDWIGETYGQPFSKAVKGYRGRRRTLKLAMTAIREYEKSLSARLLTGLAAIPTVSISGITNLDELEDRVPTVIFTVKGKSPAQVAAELGKKHIYVWDGNYYALEVMQKLGREDHGGMIRVGAAHYNTIQEVDHFLTELEHIAGNGLKVVGGNGKAKPTASTNGKPPAAKKSAPTKPKAKAKAKTAAQTPSKSGKGGAA